jgi:hypothetical protein
LRKLRAYKKKIGDNIMHTTPKKRVERKDIVKIRYLNKEYNEENLWKAVLCQAMEDATSNSSKRRILHAKKMAIKWFTEDNEDIKIVCQLAGYNHRTVKKSFKELITAHTSTF